MILYTLKDGGYRSFAESLRETPEGKRSVYVNLTNRCNCACTFCLRQTKEMGAANTLWLEREPTAAEVIAEFERCGLERIGEVVFCGFGEPTMRLDVLLETARYLKNQQKDLKIRVNTNGLSELMYGRNTAASFAGLADTVSISLNASAAEEYLRVTRSEFGLASYQAMLAFAQKCKDYVPDVVLTVVDCIGAAEIAACEKICAAIGVRLRVRPFE